MVQIKEFKRNTSITTINRFLRKYENCKIIKFSPYTILYEKKLEYESPTSEITGMPCRFDFILDKVNISKQQTDSLTIRSSQILVFHDFLIFCIHDSGFLKWNLGTNEITDNKKVSLGYTQFIVTNNHNTDPRGFDTSYENLDAFRKLLTRNGMITSISNLVYHERTNAIIVAASIQAHGMIESSKITARTAIEISKGPNRITEIPRTRYKY